MEELRIFKNSKSVNLVNSIVKNEELEVEISFITDALGDDVILIKGNAEDVNILKSIYQMVM